MSFKWYEDVNIFAILFVMAGVALWFLTRTDRPHRGSVRKQKLGLLVFMGVCAWCALTFEVYFYKYSCKVSDRYFNRQVELGVAVMQTLDELNLPYWADYASLLCLLRGQKINLWEQDIDLSMAKPDMPISKLMTLLKQDFDVVYDQPRELLQLFPVGDRRGPHVDLWIWEKSVDAKGQTVWVTADATVHYRFRLDTDLFPLKRADWLGYSTSVPAESDIVSRKEFNIYSGSYKTPVWYRGDCFHNLFQGRWWFRPTYPTIAGPNNKRGL